MPTIEQRFIDIGGSRAGPSPVGLMVSMVMGLTLTWGCGGGRIAGQCALGSRQACSGPSGCPGEHTCEGLTPSWSACRCGDMPDGGSVDAVVL